METSIEENLVGSTDVSGRTFEIIIIFLPAFASNMSSLTRIYTQTTSLEHHQFTLLLAGKKIFTNILSSGIPG